LAATVVAPFKLIAPVPVERVAVPVCEILPEVLSAPFSEIVKVSVPPD